MAGGLDIEQFQGPDVHQQIALFVFRQFRIAGGVGTSTLPTASRFLTPPKG